MKLEPCPCCLGEAGLADVKVDSIKMWQIYCAECGLSSELDEDKKYCVEQWNRRQQNYRLKLWLTGLAAMLPFIAIMAFLTGSYLGLNLFPSR